MAFSTTGCAKNAEAVAKVGDVDIIKDELYDILVQQYGEASLNALISDQVRNIGR